jgi:hypothetical protein
LTVFATRTAALTRDSGPCFEHGSTIRPLGGPPANRREVERRQDSNPCAPIHFVSKDNIRTITIGAQTVGALREHRKQQRELMMANRKSYKDFDLVFGKEHIDLQRPSHELGQPCQAIMTCISDER